MDASDARRQIDEAPAQRIKLPAQNGGRARRDDYPETLNRNTENLAYQSSTPRKAYPIVPGGQYDARGGGASNPGGGNQGMLRGVYNERERSDTMDVTYHNPSKSSRPGENLDFAPYRPSVHRDGTTGPPAPRAPSRAPAPIDSDDEDWASSSKKGKGRKKR